MVGFTIGFKDGVVIGLFVVLSLLCAVTAFGQLPNAPPVKQQLQQAPPVKDVGYPYAYHDGQREAKLHGKKIVVFVNVTARYIKAPCVVAFTKTLEGYPVKCIVVTEVGGELWQETLSASATDTEIAAAVKGVSRKTAAPFQPNVQPEAREVDASVASHAKGARFYSLKPLYQNMYTMSSRPYVDYDSIHDPAAPEHHPFIVSGGMQGLKGWRSDKALMIPDGKKVEVWRQYEEVRAFAPTIRYRWKFPAGTVAYDVLSTDKGVFEVRTQTRADDGWETKVTFKDEDARPDGYAGLQQSCASCHSHTGEIVDVPGRIYRRERWGSDGRFSWRPYKDSGELDYSWPLDMK